MIVPISAQNRIVPTASSGYPRLRASSPSTNDPARNPTAMPTPCGEMAKWLPNRKRSSTFQLIEARGVRTDRGAMRRSL